MRILLLSDIHGNLPALERILQQRLSWDTIWNLGDTVGYGPWPNECIDLVRSYPDSVHLAGNHDLAATGQTSTESFNAMAAAAADWTSQQLTDDSATWLKSLGSIGTEGDVTLAHGSPRYPAFEYIITAPQAAQMFSYFPTRHCFVGHTHRPMIVVEGISMPAEALFAPTPGQGFDLAPARALLNPGSVGQPRDGDPRAAFALYDTDSQQVVFHRVEYPVAVTQQAINAAGLPRQLAERLPLGR
jgi:diadenosine tetraphosphatase ApaH/serine/threonine PP2A family protein phosphatase